MRLKLKIFSFGYFSKCIKSLMNPTQFTDCKDAAEIIGRLSAGESSEDPWEWDDLYSVKNSNPEVSLALTLCYFYEHKYPSEVRHEYCAPEGLNYFRMISKALEARAFKNLDCRNLEKQVRKGNIPSELENILKTI